MSKRILTGLVVVGAALALPLVVGSVGVSRAVDDIYPDRPATLAEQGPTTPAALVAGRPTVAIVLGPEGANVADTLAPYEVFASTGRFNVVTVAPSAAPVVLTGGLDVVPDLTFTQLSERLPAPPEVILVPQIHGDTATVVTWLREQKRRGAPLIMSVCIGAEVLADAGLLDGRTATSHWLKLLGLRRSDPGVDWTAGVRFVDDGDVITTAGVLSGIDGSLRVLERLIDPTMAERAADSLHWNGYRPGQAQTITAQHLAPSDLVALLSAAYRWRRPATGVLLSDGVGEIELAAALRPYSELSYLARLRTVSLDGAPVRSRHGVTLLPRADWTSAAPDLDRVLVPSATVPPGWSARAGASHVPVVRLHRSDKIPFRGALRDIARTYDQASARWVGKSMQYPVRDEQLQGPRWPWGLTSVPVLLALLGAGAAVLLTQVLRHRPRRGRVS